MAVVIMMRSKEDKQTQYAVCISYETKIKNGNISTYFNTTLLCLVSNSN